MKKLILVLLIIQASSCRQTDKPSSFGSWTTIVDPKFSDPGLKDSFVFKEPNNLEIFLLQNDSLLDSYNGSFQFNQDDLTLTTKYGNQKFEFEIIELKADYLRMKEKGKNAVQVFRRLSN